MATSIDEQIAALEAQLDPEPSREQLEAREKADKLATLARKVRAQKIERLLASARDTAKGSYHVEAIDFDERAELAPQIISWVIVRGTTTAETKAFQDASTEEKTDAAAGRAKLVALAKKCILAPSLGTPEDTLAFEDMLARFGMALNTIAEKALRLGGHRLAQERAFR